MQAKHNQIFPQTSPHGPVKQCLSKEPRSHLAHAALLHGSCGLSFSALPCRLLAWLPLVPMQDHEPPAFPHGLPRHQPCLGSWQVHPQLYLAKIYLPMRPTYANNNIITNVHFKGKPSAPLFDLHNCA